jgi:hypothetical protein
MGTRNYQSAIYKSDALFQEAAKYGELKDSRARFQPKGFFMKKASEETLVERDREYRYSTKRNNRCGVCHTTKALGTGECMCSS